MRNPFICQPTGVDISDESFKYLRLKREKNKTEIDFFGEKDLPAGIVESGEIKNAKTLTEYLKNNLAPYRHEPYLVLSLPEEKGFLRLIRMQKVAHEDIRQAIEFQLEEHIPYPPQELVFDYEVLEEKAADMSVLITAYPKNLVYSYLDVARSAGFLPIIFELESQAVARAVVPGWVTDARLVGDIGKTRTTFSIICKKSVYFTSTIKIGGRDINKTLMRSLKITQDEASEIKMGRGFDFSSEDIIRNLLPLLSELTREASRQINFWEHRASSEPPISGIYLCGGDAHLRGLPEFFARELGLPVERSKIWENVFDLGQYIPPINAHDTLLFATAIGLALRGLNASVL